MGCWFRSRSFEEAEFVRQMKPTYNPQTSSQRTQVGHLGHRSKKFHEFTKQQQHPGPKCSATRVCCVHFIFKLHGRELYCCVKSLGRQSRSQPEMKTLLKSVLSSRSFQGQHFSLAISSVLYCGSQRAGYRVSRSVGVQTALSSKPCLSPYTVIVSP